MTRYIVVLVMISAGTATVVVIATSSSPGLVQIADMHVAQQVLGILVIAQVARGQQLAIAPGDAIDGTGRILREAHEFTT